MIRFINPTEPNVELFNRKIQISIDNKHTTNFGYNEQQLCLFLESIIGFPVATCCNAGVALDILATMFPTNKLPSFTFPATNTPFKNNVTYISPTLKGENIGRIRNNWTVVPFGDYRNNFSFFHADVVDAAACASPDMHVVKEWLKNKASSVVVSLHATKIWPACEGAFVAFQNEELRDIFKQKTNWGIKVDSDNFRESIGGTNGKMSELSAAYAFATWDNFVLEYQERMFFVQELIDRCRSFNIDFIPSAQSFWIAPNRSFNSSIELFAKNNIEVRNYYWNTKYTPENNLNQKGICLPVWVKNRNDKDLILETIGKL